MRRYHSPRAWMRLFKHKLFLYLVRVFYHVDLTRHIANHVMGRQHSIVHRRRVGMALIVISSFIASLLRHMFESLMIHTTVDIFAPILHVLGFSPFLHPLEDKHYHES